ncbi:MaoC/PaaZ C-terminal domain-containing protein [Streptomyces sp. CA-100214]
MTIDQNAVGRSAGPVKVVWDSTDALLYAIGVGAGQADPAAELELTTENTAGVTQQILPTYAIVLAQRAPGLRVEFGDIDRTKLVHAEQSLRLHQPLPVAGTACLTSTVTDIQDKGSGALVTTTTEAVVAGSGERLFTSAASVFIRGEGGFGGARSGASSSWTAPDRAPDYEIRVSTRPDQALLYRLCGDRNPLHSDPDFAARGGFSRPILHGLCTYGITARVLLAAVGASPSDLASIDGRFTKPVLPGAPLTVLAWNAGATNWFRVLDSEGTAVLDRGLLMLREQTGDANA